MQLQQKESRVFCPAFFVSSAEVLHVQLCVLRNPVGKVLFPALFRLLSGMGNNLNQIAKKANSDGTIYGAEISSMLEKQDEVWETSKEILARLAVIQ